MPSYECPLSTVDQLMPETITPRWLIFKLDDHETALRRARQGIDRTVSQLPFLSGEIYCDPANNYKAKIKWSDDDPKVAFEEVTGPGLPSFDEFAAQGFDMHRLPINVFSKRFMESLSSPRKPAFIASYIKLKGGLILNLGGHHALLDGGGTEMLINVWASNTRGIDHPTIKIDPRDPETRETRLDEILPGSKALSTDPKGEQRILAPLKPGLAFDPDAKGGPLPTVGRVFRFSVRKLEVLRSAMRKHTKKDFTLNSLLVSIMCIAWTSARAKTLANRAITGRLWTLCMVIGSRKFLEKEGLLEKDTFIGNLAATILPHPELPYDPTAIEHFKVEAAPLSDSIECPQAVPAVIDIITDGIAALTPWKLTSPMAHLKETLEQPGYDHRRARNWQDYGDEAFRAVTWSGFNMLQDFGPGLGRPHVLRTWTSGGPSGVCMMMPRHRAPEMGEALLDCLDVVFNAEKKEVEAVEKDELLQLLLA